MVACSHLSVGVPHTRWNRQTNASQCQDFCRRARATLRRISNTILPQRGLRATNTTIPHPTCHSCIVAVLMLDPGERAVTEARRGPDLSRAHARSNHRPILADPDTTIHGASCAPRTWTSAASEAVSCRRTSLPPTAPVELGSTASPLHHRDSHSVALPWCQVTSSFAGQGTRPGALACVEIGNRLNVNLAWRSSFSLKEGIPASGRVSRLVTREDVDSSPSRSQ